MIWRLNHFNFIKMHYLSHFTSHVRHFGSISMYSTEIGELAHEDQIKDGYHRSNKNEGAQQILSQYRRQHALGMRLQTIEALLKSEGLTEVENTGTGMPASSGLSTPRRVLKGRTKNISTLTELCRALNINYCDMTEEMLCFIKTGVDNSQLPGDPTKLEALPVERFNQLEIWVADF